MPRLTSRVKYGEAASARRSFSASPSDTGVLSAACGAPCLLRLELLLGADESAGPLNSSEGVLTADVDVLVEALVEASLALSLLTGGSAEARAALKNSMVTAGRQALIAGRARTTRPASLMLEEGRHGRLSKLVCKGPSWQHR